MPYVAPGPSSQSCLPRKAIASTVLEQTRRKAAAAGGKSSRPGSRSGPQDPSDSQSQSQSQDSTSTSTSRSGSGVDVSATTSILADQLGAAHIVDEPASIPKTLSSGSLNDHPASSAVSPISSMSKSPLSSDSEDAVSAYKAALYTYTVSHIPLPSHLTLIVPLSNIL